MTSYPLRSVLLLFGIVLVVAPAPAAAEERAAELFQDGLENMLAGRYEVGCPQIAESLRLEPLPGTVFTLAECEAKRGRIATALRHYDSYLALYTTLTPEKQARQRGREKIAAEQKVALGPEVPLLTLKLPAGAPKGTVVRRDGEELGATSLGLQLPVDPGEHVVTAEPPGGRLIEVRIKMGRGEKKTVLIEEQLPKTDPRRTAAYVAGGVGLAGIVAGSITGGLALAEKPAIDAHCHDTASGSALCNGLGKAAADRAKAFAAASTVGFGAGAAGLAAATVLYLISARPSGKTTTTVPQKRGAEVEWRWSVAGTPADHGTMMFGAEGTW